MSESRTERDTRGVDAERGRLSNSLRKLETWSGKDNPTPRSLPTTQMHAKKLRVVSDRRHVEATIQSTLQRLQVLGVTTRSQHVIHVEHDEAHHYVLLQAIEEALVVGRDFIVKRLEELADFSTPDVGGLLQTIETLEQEKTLSWATQMLVAWRWTDEDLARLSSALIDV